jgi:hypothetical protein
MKNSISGKQLFSLILFSSLTVSPLWAHSGRTDSNGGHTNRSTGTYHTHGGSSRSSISAPVSTAARISYRTYTPTVARTTIRATNVQRSVGNATIAPKKSPIKIKPPVVRELRQWTSADGQFQIKARYQAYKLNAEYKGVVTLTREESDLLEIYSYQLSTSDRLYIKSITGSSTGL